MENHTFRFSDGTIAVEENAYGQEDFYMLCDSDELRDFSRSPSCGWLAQRELDARWAMGV